MKDILNQIEQNIKKYDLIKSEDYIVIGVSGGPDSMMLLYALNALKEKLNFKFCVAHINHMIREEAGLDENLVRRVCNELGIEIHVLTFDVLNEAKRLKISTEECGRNVRYDFFKKVMEEIHANKIAVAHNLGDNAETILMNIVRGTGLTGLCGMEYVNGNIIRPMLNIDKKDIIQYLDENNIPYAIDKTNLQNDYTRNSIRNELIVKLEQINPNILSTINRMAESIKQDETILNNLVYEQVQDIIIDKTEDSIYLDVKKFRQKQNELQPRLVRYVLNELLGKLEGIEQVHVEDICELLNKCITGKKYIIGKKFTIEILKNKKAKCVKVNTIIE